MRENFLFQEHGCIMTSIDMSWLSGTPATFLPSVLLALELELLAAALQLMLA